MEETLEDCWKLEWFENQKWFEEEQVKLENEKGKKGKTHNKGLEERKRKI